MGALNIILTIKCIRVNSVSEAQFIENEKMQNADSKQLMNFLV